MTYIILDNETEAEDRSRKAWEEHLGRKKHPGDVTEFLWGWDVGKDGKAALVISEEPERLKPEEAQAVVADLPDGKGENWEKPEPLSETGEITADP